MEAMVTERSNYVFTHRFSGNGFFLGLKKRDFSSLKTINPSLLSHSKVLQENNLRAVLSSPDANAKTITG